MQMEFTNEEINILADNFPTMMANYESVLRHKTESIADAMSISFTGERLNKITQLLDEINEWHELGAKHYDLMLRICKARDESNLKKITKTP